MRQSLMGMHFNPDASREAGYPRTADFWDAAKTKWEEGDDKVKYLIEAVFHALGDWEHESEYDGFDDDILTFAKLAVGVQ